MNRPRHSLLRMDKRCRGIKVETSFNHVRRYIRRRWEIVEGGHRNNEGRQRERF